MSPAPPLAGLTETTLDRGVRMLGFPYALHPLFSQLQAGKPITIAVLGASVGQNGGCLHQQGKRCMEFRGKGHTPVGFAVRLLRYINQTWPADHRINNAALDGTGVEHISRCIAGAVAHSGAHLVIAEWGSMALHTTHSLPSIERVARIILSQPSPPVLLHLSVHEWCSQRVTPRSLYTVGDVLKGSLRNWIYPDTPWAAVEEESTRVSRHYGHPSLSVHAALAPHVLSGEAGFSLRDITGDDCLHPVNGRRGVDYVEALLVHWLERARRLWRMAHRERRDLLQPPRAGRMGGSSVLPPPLHPSNEGTRFDTRCYAFVHERMTRASQMIMARAAWCSHSETADPAHEGLQTSVHDAVADRLADKQLLSDVHWSGGGASQRAAAACWASEHASCKLEPSGGKGGRASPQPQRDKAQAAYEAFVSRPPHRWFHCGISLGARRRKISDGVVAVVPGATLRARVDPIESAEAEVRLEHLVSYEGMGTVRLECSRGCECHEQLIDAHRTNGIRNVSVFLSHTFTARAPRRQHAALAERKGKQPMACELLLTLLERTSSGAHKFKVRSITVTGALPMLDGHGGSNTTPPGR
jgi:hypothetical protein